MSASQFAPVAYAAWQGSGSFSAPDVATDCTVERSATGVYVLTLTGNNASETNFSALASVSPSALNISNAFNITHTSDTVKTIRFYSVATALATDDFYFTIGVLRAVRTP